MANVRNAYPRVTFPYMPNELPARLEPWPPVALNNWGPVNEATVVHSIRTRRKLRNIAPAPLRESNSGIPYSAPVPARQRRRAQRSTPSERNQDVAYWQRYLRSSILTDDERLLVKLKVIDDLTWKNIEASFNRERGTQMKQPALQMRMRRLKNRLKKLESMTNANKDDRGEPPPEVPEPQPVAPRPGDYVDIGPPAAPATAESYMSSQVWYDSANLIYDPIQFGFEYSDSGYSIYPYPMNPELNSLPSLRSGH